MADIVILDPGVAWTDIGAEVATLREVAPSAALVILTPEPLDPDASSQALLAGVEAQLTKDAGPAELLGALVLAVPGNFVVIPRGQPGHVERPRLTRRELDILTLLAQGSSNQAVAEILWLTPSMVKFHLANVMQKLGVRSQKEAVHRAKVYGLIPRWGGWDAPPAAGEPAA